MSENTNEKKDNFAYSNPIKGALASLGLTAAVAIGASIRHNDLKKECLTTLAGGAVVGAIAGVAGRCIPDSHNFKLCGSLSIQLLQHGIGLAVAFLAPMMGEQLLGLDNQYIPTIEDSLIGAGVITAGVVGTVALTTCGACLFFKPSEQPTIQNLQFDAVVSAPEAVTEVGIQLNNV